MGKDDVEAGGVETPGGELGWPAWRRRGLLARGSLVRALQAVGGTIGGCLVAAQVAEATGFGGRAALVFVLPIALVGLLAMAWFGARWLSAEVVGFAGFVQAEGFDPARYLAETRRPGRVWLLGMPAAVVVLAVGLLTALAILSPTC